MNRKFFNTPMDPSTVRESGTGAIVARCLKDEIGDRIVTALNRESDEDALAHALIAALKALHVAHVHGGISMADLVSIAIRKCREVVQRDEAWQSHLQLVIRFGEKFEFASNLCFLRCRDVEIDGLTFRVHSVEEDGLALRPDNGAGEYEGLLPVIHKPWNEIREIRIE